LIKPLKKFGQNYLIDKNIISNIISVISPKKDDVIIEIGPGRGALTDYLAKSSANVYAIEIDFRVIEELKAKLPHVTFINEDFLDIDLHFFKSDNLRVVGNIPYNITSPILFKIFENNLIVNDAILMVQYEVAKRMISKRGSKDYGILAVLVDYFSETKICFKVSPNVFLPKPKVFSAVVHLEIKKRKDLLFNKTFVSVVKSAFGNRRKILKNSFSNSIFAQLNFEDCRIDFSKRAEQLTTENFIYLTEYITQRLKEKNYE
jgi:16S rRNA (adenine1518-N6/adenine1519-N6)-dimethyltransferase